MSTSPARSKKSTREAILDAAARLFMDQSLKAASAVTLEAVAEKAGVSRQSVYIHFGSRTQLLLAMVRHLDEKTAGLDEHIRQLAEAPNAIDALNIAFTAPGGYYPVVYSAAKLFLAGKYEDEALKAAWEDRMEARHKICHLLVRRLNADGVLSPAWDVRTAIDVLWVLTSWQVWEQLVIDRGWSNERYTDFLRRTVHQTLIDQSSGARRSGTAQPLPKKVTSRHGRPESSETTSPRSVQQRRIGPRVR